ncbi:SDR family oxidoreductase [candidate division KSB1 bacterium]|nr:SDR family oxidoreductase [candidate division KSB1 bacterium]
MTTNQTALVTGASSGIGREIAEILIDHGYSVVVTARTEATLTSLKEKAKTSGQVIAIPLDLAHPNGADRLVEKLNQEGIQIDLLINNAGFGDYTLFHLADWSKIADMLQLNITALTRLTHLLLPGMIERGSGRILNVASVASFFPGPLMAVYYATKAYVLSFSEALANETQDTGVTVTTLCPGPTESGFQETANMNHTRVAQQFKMPDSRSVAEFGVRAMLAGKRVAIHGWMNRLFIFAQRFLPRSLVLTAVRRVQESRHD